jgi:hypothetical protein
MSASMSTILAFTHVRASALFGVLMMKQFWRC